MICHHYKCIFVHIPKNAGQSIEHVFLNLLGLTWETRAPLLLRYNDRPELGPPRLAHLKAGEYVRYHYLTREMFDDYFTFAFVRNPWSRMVSLYHYLGYGGRSDFNTFLSGAFKNSIFHEQYWFVGPQSAFICGPGGELLVDFVGRFERLQDDFDRVCGHIGLPETQLPHVNESRGPDPVVRVDIGAAGSSYLYCSGANAVPRREDYRDYYDRASIDLVAELYAKDIALFGYDFE